jgi:hypothetical protein
MHKRFKCLDISTGRIYISRDVTFEESIFWFASLNSITGARYHSEVLLLPSSQPRDNRLTNATNVITVFVLPMLNPPMQLQQESQVHQWSLYMILCLFRQHIKWHLPCHR